jgi:hypothetical protein
LNALTTTASYKGDVRLTGGSGVSNNQLVEFKVNGTPNGDLTMRLRDNKAGAFYIAFIYNNRVIFSRYQNWNNTQMGETLSVAIANGDRLQFRIFESKLYFSVNGNVKASLADTLLPTGRPGLSLDSPTIGIDDLIIGSDGPTPSPAPSPPPSAAGRYSYNFNTADGTSLETYSSPLAASAGMRITGNALTTTSLWSSARLSYGTAVSANQMVEFKVIGTPNGDISMKLRDGNNGSYYVAYLSSNRVQFAKYQSWNQTYIGTQLNIGIVSGDKVQFRIVGNQLVFARNGVDLATITDSTLLLGMPGFTLDNPGVALDDLVIGSY